ncbi:hypothetical protein ACH4S8_02880 [Streptomyces sp. NPDC021080]|uniref:hypothetical protein n=1 Tax=Streptomyces sp. NPDC021080 TaxID=3365110 RepID=UPI0037BC9FB0
MTLGSVRSVVPVLGSQSEDDAMGDEVYQPGGPDIREDEGILDPEDTLEYQGSDPFDEGWSPPERPLAVNHRGTTAREQREGESLDEKLAEERTDPALQESDEDDGEGGPTEDGAGLPDDDVGAEDPEERILALDVGAHEDAEHDMIAEHVGADDGPDPTDEATGHLIPEDDMPERLDEGLRRPPEDEVRRLRSETDT